MSLCGHTRISVSGAILTGSWCSYCGPDTMHGGQGSCDDDYDDHYDGDGHDD